MNRSIIVGALSLCLSLPALAESPALERTKHALGLPLATPLAVIPTLANTPGRFGAYFKTRVVIHNLTTNSYTLDAILCGPNGIVAQQSISMSANQYRSYDNFLQDVFNYRGAGITVGQDRRVNVGVFNLGVSTIPVKAIVHDSSGFVTQTIDLSVGALSWQQKTVSRPVDNGFIRWQIDARGGLPFLWAVSVDNRSNDGTLTWPARPDVTLE